MKKFFSCLVLLAVSVNAASVPNDEIWYTSTNGNVVTPFSTSVFGASILSNTYSKGKGVIKFSGSVTSIGINAFYNCSTLSSIDIPTSVTKIDDWAFNFCSNLGAITIPVSVTYIGYGAFDHCTSLSSVFIPKFVKTIHEYAFSCCPNMAYIEVGDGNTAYDSRGNCNAIIHTATNELVSGCKNTFIPSSVTGIREAAFMGCKGLTTFSIPSSVTKIGLYAFSECSNLTTLSYDIVDDINAFNIGGNISKMEMTYSRTFKNHNWQALYVPFNIDVEDVSDNFDVAEINASVITGEILVIDKLTEGTLKGNTPYFIRLKNNKATGEYHILTNGTLLRTTYNSISVGYFTITGIFEAMNGTQMKAKDAWALSGNAFHQANTAAARLNPFRFYLTGARSEVKVVVDEETGIDSLTPTHSTREGEIFNLVGQKLQKIQKGVNIINGKKVLF